MIVYGSPEYYGYLPERILSSREYEMALKRVFPNDRYAILDTSFTYYRRSRLTENNKWSDGMKQAEKIKLLQEAIDV